jgi:4-amino-4-deoxy-L-arabinose transferase-like glycosyltransferase
MRRWRTFRSSPPQGGSHLLLLAAILITSVGLHYAWLYRFRHGFLTEWDESGYMQFALSNFDALHDHGLISFAKTVGGRGTFGPLLPFVTSLAYPVVGRGVFGSLLVMPIFFIALVLSAYGLARRLVTPWWAVLAALAVAAIPAVTDYTRLYHFALPAAACLTAALWALLRSNGLRRTGWAIASGAFVGLMTLARTMTVVFLPGLVLAAALQLLGDRGDLGQRRRNLALTLLSALVTAGLWYARNGRSVADYLLQSGYGERSARFGHRYPVLSWGFWTKELRIDLNYISLPLAVALALAFLVALGFLIAGRRSEPTRRWGRLARPGMLALVVVVAAGYLVLTSSRNEGTGFALPWLPALVILAVVAAATVPIKTARFALAAAIAGTSILALVSKSGWIAPLASLRTAAVPGLGTVVVTDGRGLIQYEVAGAGYEIGNPTSPLPNMHRQWLPFEHRVMGALVREADHRGKSLRVVLGFDDLLFSNTRLILAGTLWYHRFVPVGYIQAGDAFGSYRSQLAAKPADALITGQERTASGISRQAVEEAARSLGFVKIGTLRMPDGRKIWMWWRNNPRV